MLGLGIGILVYILLYLKIIDLIAIERDEDLYK